jgi:hypothetical protein
LNVGELENVMSEEKYDGMREGVLDGKPYANG